MELFITPLDDRKQWFRYHHLFQELLKMRLKAGSEEETEEVLHRRASAWFEKQGMLDEAIYHAREFGDLEMAAYQMEKGLKDALNREDHLTLEYWIHLLPEEYLQSRPIAFNDQDLVFGDFLAAWRHDEGTPAGGSID